MKAIRIVLFLVVTLTLAGGAVARPLQRVLNEGDLRIGVALASPWAIETADGEYVGFEIDVARKLAQDMGVEPVISVHEWNELVPALESGEIDIIAAGLTITPDRALHVNFSRPYAAGGIALATNLEATAAVERLSDLDSDAYRIAAIQDSAAAALARQILPSAELVPFEDVEAAGNALTAGRVHGYLEDEPVPTFLALENPDVVDVPLAEPLLGTRSGFAVAKGDPDFLAFLDAWIVAREADTWLPTTHHYWFETLRWRDAYDAPTPH